MALGKLVVFFTVLLVCQASFVKQSKPRVGDIDAEYVSISKTLGKIVTLVTNVVDTVVTDLDTIVNQANGDNLDNLQQQTLDVTKTVMGLVKSLVTIDLINMEADADDDTTVVVDCLLNNMDNYVDVIASFYDTFTKCHNPSLGNLSITVSVVLQDVSSMIKDIQTTGGQLDDCSDLSCIASVAAQILDSITGFFDTDADEIKNIGGAVVSWATSFPTCLQSTITDWKKSAGQEVETFAKCVRS